MHLTDTCVTVIGAGIMGHGIAQALASGGAQVLLADQDLRSATAGRDSVARNLDNLLDGGHTTAARAAALLARITPVARLEDGADSCTIVVEAVPEVMALKRTVLQRAEAVCARQTIFASNTSSFDLDHLAAGVQHPDRLVGAHWYNPAYLIPVVEVVPGRATSSGTVDRITAALQAAGKQAVLTGNRAGFIGNRLQFALVAEAFRCLEEGVASAADVDAIVAGSFGMRLAEYGPFRLADLGGLDTYRSVLEYLAEHLGDRFAPPQSLRDLVDQGRLGLKSGQGVYTYAPQEAAELVRQRDERLAVRVHAPDTAAAGTRPEVPNNELSSVPSRRSA